eukprot:g3169.t1
MFTARGRQANAGTRSRSQPGPGAYDPKVNAVLMGIPRCGFGTATRADITGAASSLFGPGPGAYDLQNAMSLGKNGPKYSATSRRRVHDLDSYVTPGPGTYNAHTTSFVPGQKSAPEFAFTSTDKAFHSNDRSHERLRSRTHSMDLSSRPAECQEKLSELQKRFDFSEAELVCFELNSGTLSLAKMAAFESFLQVQRDKRVPKKPFLRTDRPLARPLTAGPPFAGDHKRPPSQVTTPINKRTREAAYADDAGTPAPLPMPSHQISVKSSINTGNLEKTSLSQRSEVKLLGPCFWAGEEGHDAYTWMDEAISERAVRRDERLQAGK